MPGSPSSTPSVPHSLQQHLIDVSFAAQVRFRGQPLRIWYVKLGRRSWKAIVLHSGTKRRLAVGPSRATHLSALQGLKARLERQISERQR